MRYVPAARLLTSVCCWRSFIKQYLNASNAGEVEALKAELDKVKAEKAELEKELVTLKGGAPAEE